eukprot:6441647-Amphidinium_carterae.4
MAFWEKVRAYNIVVATLVQFHQKLGPCSKRPVQPPCVQGSTGFEFGKTDVSVLACSLNFLSGPWTHGLEHGVTVFMKLHDRAMGHRFRRAFIGHLCSQHVLTVSGPSVEDNLSPFTLCLGEGARFMTITVG